jgi:hypothetical protein
MRRSLRECVFVDLGNLCVERSRQQIIERARGAATQSDWSHLASGQRYGARGVVLASGGFSRAPDLVERFVPHLRAARPMGPNVTRACGSN